VDILRCSIGEKMNNVPTWVYMLFFLLLYIGIKRCYTRVISVNRIIVVPIVFIFLSIRNTITLFDFSWIGFFLLVFGGCAGALLGCFQAKNRVIRSDKVKRLIEIPGDISMLLMVMLVFFIEFIIHYAVDAHWMIAQYGAFKNVAVILSGIVVGISAGRSATYFYKYKYSESVDLSET
jgi:hypothetical protein